MEAEYKIQGCIRYTEPERQLSVYRAESWTLRDIDSGDY